MGTKKCVRVCACVHVRRGGVQVGMFEFVFEGENAFKRIQMGDRDYDGAALYKVALGRF